MAFAASSPSASRPPCPDVTPHDPLPPDSTKSHFFAGYRGSPQFPHPPSPHAAADPPPVGPAVSDSSRTAPAAFARYRPSRPPDLRVTRLRLRSHTLQPGALRTSF